MSPPTTPPLGPTNDQARQWLTDELSKARYDSPFDFFAWLDQLLTRLIPDRVGGLGLQGWVIPTITALVLVTAVVLVLRAGGVSGRRRSRSPGALVDDPTLTATDYRRLAAEAEAAEDWATVTLQSYRAIAVGATERTLLEERAGRTAHEVVDELGPVFPGFEERLAEAAEAFDVVRYGDGTATRDAALATRLLDDDLRRTRPVLPEAPVPA